MATPQPQPADFFVCQCIDLRGGGWRGLLGWQKCWKVFNQLLVFKKNHIILYKNLHFQLKVLSSIHVRPKFTLVKVALQRGPVLPHLPQSLPLPMVFSTL